MELWRLADLSTPWSVHVVATLRIADHIAAGHTEIHDLAFLAGANPEYLGRVLRHLASRGVFEEPQPGVFALNDAARGLIGEAGRAGFDLEGIGGRMAYAWGTMLSAVRTGRPAYHEHFGRDWWSDLDANPKITEDFDRMMGPGHGTPDPDVLIEAPDWDKVRSIVDVGGGTGSLLAEVLRAQPHVRGTLVDLPRTVARAGEVFRSAGVADRATVRGQSFFDPLPSGADVYLLKSVLCDWPDAEAEKILARCAEAARPSGRVVALNGVTPGKAADPNLLMMILVGGKDRTLEEFRALAQRAGLAVAASGRTASGRFIVECTPA